MRLKYTDSGSAARFFYCAKASRKERCEFNNHPTVKPIDLMKYLIKLVCPPKEILLDPFGGSGSTAIAAEELGRKWILIEQDEHNCEIAAKRLQEREKNNPQLNLF